MHKLITHEYFLDYMQIVDIPIITRYLEYADVIEWNQTRNIMLSVLRPYLKKKNLKADEFFPLPIDETWHRKDEMTTELDKGALEWFKAFKQNYKKDSQ